MTEILKTQNKIWGFWGAASNHIEHKEDMQAFWDKAAEIIQSKGLTPQQTLDLMDSRWGRHIADEFAEELNCDLETFEKAFKHKMTKGRLQKDFNYYVDSNAYKTNEITRHYENFSKELARLTQKYGVVLHVVGGVYFSSKEDLQDFIGYTTDLDSGDIEPIWRN